MKENYIEENVILVEKILFQFILQINLTKSMTKKYGGVINGIQCIIEEILILVDDFLNSLKN